MPVGANAPPTSRPCNGWWRPHRGCAPSGPGTLQPDRRDRGTVDLRLAGAPAPAGRPGATQHRVAPPHLRRGLVRPAPTAPASPTRGSRRASGRSPWCGVGRPGAQRPRASRLRRVGSGPRTSRCRRRVGAGCEVPTFALAQTVVDGVPDARVADELEAILGAAYSASVFTTWRRAIRVDGMPAQNATQQLGEVGPWHLRAPPLQAGVHASSQRRTAVGVPPAVKAFITASGLRAGFLLTKRASLPEPVQRRHRRTLLTVGQSGKPPTRSAPCLGQGLSDQRPRRVPAAARRGGAGVRELCRGRLGIAAMLDVDVESLDALTGEHVTAGSRDGRWTWQPVTRWRSSARRVRDGSPTRAVR